MTVGTTTDGLAPDQAPRLLSSNHVDRIAVYGRDADKLGSIAAFLIDRFSGQVDYVVVAIGGMLGLGGNYHTLPWSLIAYDPSKEGYVVAVEKAVLSGGPSFKAGAEPIFNAAYVERVSNYYGVSPRLRDCGLS